MKRKTDQSDNVATTRTKSLVNSKPEVPKVATKCPSILVDICASPFALKRRSNPAAAFAEMMDTFFAATREDNDIARAFASFQKHFRGVVLQQEDAIRLDTLMERGAGKLRIKVGSLPYSMGPGLAFMYDAALETLRSSDRPIEPGLIGAPAIRAVERSLDKMLPLIGSMSVTALELALNDKRYADHLRQRALEIGIAGLKKSISCDFCDIVVTDADGTVTSYCGSQQECQNVGGFILTVIILWLLYKFLDWIF